MYAFSEIKSKESDDLVTKENSKLTVTIEKKNSGAKKNPSSVFNGLKTCYFKTAYPVFLELSRTVLVYIESNKWVIHFFHMYACMYTGILLHRKKRY